MILKNKIKITGMEKLKPCPFCGYDAEVCECSQIFDRFSMILRKIYCPHEYKCYPFGAVEKNFDSAGGCRKSVESA